MIEAAKKAKQGKGKGGGKGKDKGKKGKGKGKGKICPFFNDKGRNYGSACKMLHEAPAIPLSLRQPLPRACMSTTPPAPSMRFCSSGRPGLWS